MIWSHLFWGHNEQSLRSGRKKEGPVEGTPSRGVSWFDKLGLHWAEHWYDSYLLWSGHLRSAWKKYLNRLTSQRYALKERTLHVAHCGFTIHEPGLYSSSTKKALFNIVRLKLCACLSFPYWQQLEKMAENGEEGKEGGGELKHWKRQLTTLLINEAPDLVMSLASKCNESVVSLPDTEARVNIKQDCQNETHETKDSLPWFLKVLGYIYPHSTLGPLFYWCNHYLTVQNTLL